MPKLYEAPSLKRYGTVGDLTASDFKCTPGGDGSFSTLFADDHGDEYYSVNGIAETDPQHQYTGTFDPKLKENGFSGCRSLTDIR